MSPTPGDSYHIYWSMERLTKGDVRLCNTNRVQRVPIINSVTSVPSKFLRVVSLSNKLKWEGMDNTICSSLTTESPAIKLSCTERELHNPKYGSENFVVS